VSTSNVGGGANGEGDRRNGVRSTERGGANQSLLQVPPFPSSSVLMLFGCVVWAIGFCMVGAGGLFTYEPASAIEAIFSPFIQSLYNCQCN